MAFHQITIPPFTELIIENDTPNSSQAKIVVEPLNKLRFRDIPRSAVIRESELSRTIIQNLSPSDALSQLNSTVGYPNETRSLLAQKAISIIPIDLLIKSVSETERFSFPNVLYELLSQEWTNEIGMKVRIIIQKVVNTDIQSCLALRHDLEITHPFIYDLLVAELYHRNISLNYNALMELDTALTDTLIDQSLLCGLQLSQQQIFNLMISQLKINGNHKQVGYLVPKLDNAPNKDTILGVMFKRGVLYGDYIYLPDLIYYVETDTFPDITVDEYLTMARRVNDEEAVDYLEDRISG